MTAWWEHNTCTTCQQLLKCPDLLQLTLLPVGRLVRRFVVFFYFHFLFHLFLFLSLSLSLSLQMFIVYWNTIPHYADFISGLYYILYPISYLHSTSRVEQVTKKQYLSLILEWDRILSRIQKTCPTTVNFRTLEVPWFPWEYLPWPFISTPQLDCLTKLYSSFCYLLTRL